MPRPNKFLYPALMFLLGSALMLPASPALALKSDRQKPLLINADASDGTLGDGKATLRGNVEIRQGTMLVKADQADVEKTDGKVQEVLLVGKPALLQQEIENEGLVTATANTITYQVATGIVTLNGNADVDHPQYQISGDLLVYDMNLQHFQGSGGDNNGRIRIQLEPEVISAPESKPEPKPATAAPTAPGQPDESRDNAETGAVKEPADQSANSGSNAAN
jgi:lipopolysaccharide export system protein LptA